MNITEIRIKLTNDNRNKLKAYCSITFDNAFVVRDLKIIEGGKGLFIAMPSRKLSDRCQHCGGKNHLRASFCNSCGGKLDGDRAVEDERGRARLHADLAHPINSQCRTDLHRSVVRALESEMERSMQDDYVPASFDDLDEAEDFLDDRDVAAYGGKGGSATVVPGSPGSGGSSAPASRPVERERSVGESGA